MGAGPLCPKTSWPSRKTERGVFPWGGPVVAGRWQLAAELDQVAVKLTFHQVNAFYLVIHPF